MRVLRSPWLEYFPEKPVLRKLEQVNDSRATGQDLGIELSIHLNHILLFLRLLFVQLKFNVDLFPFSPCFPHVNSSFLIASKTLLMMIPNLTFSSKISPGLHIYVSNCFPDSWTFSLSCSGLNSSSYPHKQPFPTISYVSNTWNHSWYHLYIKSYLFFAINISQNTIFLHSHCHYPINPPSILSWNSAMAH